MSRIAVVWFRRDLRLHDNPALAAAIAEADAVVPVFVFDPALLDGRWPAANRVWFMRQSVAALAADLEARGAGMRVLAGRPAEVLPALVRELGAGSLYLARDATPYGRRRDQEVAAAVAQLGVAVHPQPGLYVQEPDQVLTGAGGPFSVFGAFRRAWEAMPRRLVMAAPPQVPGVRGGERSDPVPEVGRPTADPSLIPAPGEAAARVRLERWLAGPGLDGYAAERNRMDLDATSRLSQDLRFGLLSPLEVVERAMGVGDGRRAYVAELAWREFYGHVLWHQPRVVREPFQRAFAAVPWRDEPGEFEAWAEGRTGYPVVDAAMRQLRTSGFVHNRARMVAASFLVKHLLIDWRRGEAEFMAHLVDGDLASNNGGWQWVAGTGTDAAPYFRVFNPVLQGRRFDPAGDYVRRWVPELRGITGGAVHEPWTLGRAEQEAAGVIIGRDYPAPIVDHRIARERALAAFAAARVAAGG